MLIPPGVLSLHTCSDPESQRYALGGVKIERVGSSNCPLAIATDGHKLMCVQWREDNPAEFPMFKGNDWNRLEDYEVIVPAAACKDAAKLPPKRSLKPILLNVAIDEKNTNGNIPMGGTNLEQWSVINPRSLEGRYPDWRKTIPKFRPEETQSILIDARHMIDLMQAFIKTGCTDKEHNGVVLTIRTDDWGNNHPILLTSHLPDNSRNGCAVLMPLTSERGVKLEPAWIPGQEAPKPKPDPDEAEVPKPDPDEADWDEEEKEDDDEEMGEMPDDDADRPLRDKPSKAELKEARKQTAAEAMAEAQKIVAAYAFKPKPAAPTTPYVAPTVECDKCGKSVKKMFLTEKRGKLCCPDCL